jgi:hypothetical protein
MLFLRFLHIVLGAAWFGAAFLFVGFIGPSAAEVGPSAGPLLSAVVKKRKAARIITWIGMITITVGWIMWLRSSRSTASLTSRYSSSPSPPWPRPATGSSGPLSLGWRRIPETWTSARRITRRPPRDEIAADVWERLSASCGIAPHSVGLRTPTTSCGRDRCLCRSAAVDAVALAVEDLARVG